MKTVFCSSILLAATMVLNSCSQQGKESPQSKQIAFSEARKNFKTKIVRKVAGNETPPTPPAAIMKLVNYETDIGPMVAYLSNVPQDDKRHPAMIWITGGFGNDIGDVWTEQDAADDQSAASIRNSGMVMMYPAQRGGNGNPGSDECFYGEIDDIISAAKYLASQPGIDPKRIYLGGHSTGGTKALLAAAASPVFRAVFSLGPASSAFDYGDEHATYDVNNQQEQDMRDIKKWLPSLTQPVFIMEGKSGNYEAMKMLEAAAKDQKVDYIQCITLEKDDHFSGIQKVCRAIGQKIIADIGAKVAITLTAAELN